MVHGYRIYHQPMVGNPMSMHHELWRAFMIMSGFLSFTTTPFMNFVNVHIIHKMYLSPTLLRSVDTIELKSVALGIATDGFDLDLEFFLQISHCSRTFSMIFLVTSLSLPAFLNA